MVSVAIVGNGPEHLHPDLELYRDVIDIWIGADRGTLHLIKNNLPVNYAVGDFDSINEDEKQAIQQSAAYYKEYPSEKDEADLEIALSKAFDLSPKTIYLFGVTGGRLDHELITIQLLYSIINKGIKGIILDQSNYLELTLPGSYLLEHDDDYPAISFIPYTQYVKGITLAGFYYPLVNQTITWGSTLSISNKLLLNNGTFSFEEGILLLVKSRDTIPV
ncbi:thiamine diphosphokinase [Virgibacillus sp. C22-A2]|uniref:Thiamine diphosphokinase n=1 Tax=Virgibacillus tibetensis TaxID=3042313 RepID=A0ABU6KD37_9BACI|nr:thiamine diphosphokinase [Virgibacillus sp. C22-A2]